MSLSYGSLSLVPLKLKASFSGLPHLVWMLGAIVLLSTSGRMVSTFLAVYLLTFMELSEQHIGLIVGAYGCGTVTGSLLGGWISSRVPPVPLMTASLALMGFGFISLSGVTDPNVFLIGIFICANCEAVFRPPSTLFLMQACSPIDRPRSHAVFYTALGIGYAIGAAVGGILSQIDFSLLFWANGTTSIIAGAAVPWLLRAHAGNPNTKSVEDAVSADRREVGPLSIWPFVALCAAVLFHYYVSYQRLATYPLYLTTHYNLNTAELGALFAVNGVLSAVMAIPINAFVRQIDQRKVASAGCLALCASFALLPFGSHIEMALVLCVIMSLGDALFPPSSISLAYFLAPSKSEGSLLGIFFAILYSSRVLSPVLGIWSLTVFGGTATWLFCGVLGVLTTVILCGLLRTRYP